MCLVTSKRVPTSDVFAVTLSCISNSIVSFLYFSFFAYSNISF